MILPKLEVDTYLSNLLGPDYTIEDGFLPDLRDELHL